MVLGESTCKFIPIFLLEKTANYLACDKALAARSLSVIEFDCLCCAYCWIYYCVSFVVRHCSDAFIFNS